MPGVVVQGVLARDLTLADVLRAHQGSNAGIGVVNVVEVAVREHSAGLVDQILERVTVPLAIEASRIGLHARA